MNFLDLSGYMDSGKGAVADLVKEFSGFYCADNYYEFFLIRVQDGIMDLEQALVNSWSPIRTDSAIRRFKKLIGTLARKPSLLNPLDWFRLGWWLDKRYPGFSRYSDEYVRSICQIQWKAPWPYANLEMTPMEIFYRRVLRALRFKGAFDTDLYLGDGHNFIDATQTYLTKVLSADAPANTSTVVMCNGFEPYNTDRGLRYFKNAKAIVIDRDPRDSYISACRHSESFKKTVAGQDVNQFVSRYKMMREKSPIDPLNKQLLLIHFEDLVLNYDETCHIIYKFLGIDESAHIYKKKHFDPECSKKNIGLWKARLSDPSIHVIKEALNNYCYNSA